MHRDVYQLPHRVTHTHLGEAAVFGFYVRLFLRAGNFGVFERRVHVFDLEAEVVDAFTPTLGFATKVVSVTVLVFFFLIGVVFWIASLHDRPDFRRTKEIGQADAHEAELT